MVLSWGKRQTESLTVQTGPNLPLIAGIELILESPSIFKAGFFYFFSLSESGSGRWWNPRWLELALFLQSDQEFLTGVWTLRLDLWPWVYTEWE